MRLPHFCVPILAGACSPSPKADPEPVDTGITETRETTPEDEGCGADCAYVPAVTYESVQESPEFVIQGGLVGRELPALVRFPEDPEEPLPVVIWSHGGGYKTGGHRRSQNWSEAFVRAGYAVVHYSMVAPTPEQLESICQIAGLTDPADCMDFSLDGEVPKDDPDFVNPFSSGVYVRVSDGHSVLADLPRIAGQLEDRGLTLDLDRIAVAGHSAGSQTVLQLAGATRLASDALPPHSDPSAIPDAFVAVSPQGPGSSNYFADDAASSWDAVRGPMLVMTGDGDLNPGNDIVGEERRQAYENMPPSDKRLFYSTAMSEQIRHGSFNLEDRSNRDDELVALGDALVSAAVAHLDAHLRGRAEAVAWLESDDIVELVEGAGEWESK
ncbi:MAG: hypothetical protein AAF602_10135 [Myxococcota bacterium]